MKTYYMKIIYTKYKKAIKYNGFDSNSIKKTNPVVYEQIQQRMSKKISYNCECENCIQAKTSVIMANNNKIKFNKMRV